MDRGEREAVVRALRVKLPPGRAALEDKLTTLPSKQWQNIQILMGHFHETGDKVFVPEGLLRSVRFVPDQAGWTRLVDVVTRKRARQAQLERDIAAGVQSPAVLKQLRAEELRAYRRNYMRRRRAALKKENGK
jgi:hypothetical protein